MPELNRLIERLPRADRERLLSSCEEADLVLGETLAQSGEAPSHVYFPTKGFISLLKTSDNADLEVGMIGNEGMLGAHVALGVAISPWRALVQGGGKAWRIDAAAFSSVLVISPVLRQSLNEYVYVLLAEMATLAVCQSFHSLPSRLARWLLMSRDRAGSNTFAVTHEFLAYMMGVRRSGVTIAAGKPQRQGIIEYRRGQLHVCDVRRLKSAACSCYAADKKAYAFVMS